MANYVVQYAGCPVFGRWGVPLPSDETLEMVASSDGESIFILSRMGDEWVWGMKPKLESVLNLISGKTQPGLFGYFSPQYGQAILVGRDLTWNPERDPDVGSWPY